ncbi:MAG: hypothetical protein NXH75_03030 [Halobacteriovoraceae bacterium]|nr:hypothetical protein [Halobacteriovoraceae bacterium]
MTSQLQPYEIKAQNFLKIADQFKLGELVTESPHPFTLGLSQMVKLNMDEAIKSFVKVDEQMLEVLLSKALEIFELSQRIKDCFDSGGRLYLSGCGATGRLSLVIENLWRQSFPDNADQVKGFMAGGDLALIHSIEKFEDFPEYGARQLKELGFKKGDLLLASTEGGETPWVIGTALEAIKLGGSCTYLYCNPDEVLLKNLQRCQEVLKHPLIQKLNLTSGPQALTGSTRLQASTIITAAIGTALFENSDQAEIYTALSQFKDWYLSLEHTHMKALIEKEAQVYGEKKGVYYLPDQSLAISVLTDTTERSPTFSLVGFDNKKEETSHPSLSFLAFSHSENSEVAWKKLLYREPHTLEWDEVKLQAGKERLYGFDFSRDVFRWRKERVPHFSQFSIRQKADTLLMELDGVQAFFSLPAGHSYKHHLILKMLLNMHSTLLMGLMGRYESNVMTYVRPSNNKLVDRCVRYASQLLEEKEIVVSYEDLVTECFRLMKDSIEDRPVVKELVKIFSTH